MIDADEQGCPELWLELLRRFPSHANEVVAVPRRNYLGRSVLATGRDYQYRLFHRSSYVYAGAVHETLMPKPLHSHTIFLRTPLEHQTYDCLVDWLQKLIRYAQQEANSNPSLCWKDYLRPIYHGFRFGVFHGGFARGRAGRLFAVLTMVYFFLVFALKVEMRVFSHSTSGGQWPLNSPE
jgi:hypothetical protein